MRPAAPPAPSAVRTDSPTSWVALPDEDDYDWSDEDEDDESEDDEDEDDEEDEEPEWLVAPAG